MRAPGIVDVLSGVAREVSDCGIDLAERNLHMFSVKQDSWLRPSGDRLRVLGLAAAADPLAESGSKKIADRSG